MKKAEIGAAVGHFDLLADQKVIEMTDYRDRLARHRVEPEDFCIATLEMAVCAT